MEFLLDSKEIKSYPTSNIEAYALESLGHASKVKTRPLSIQDMTSGTSTHDMSIEPKASEHSGHDLRKLKS